MASSFATVIFGLSVFIVVVNAAILDFNFKKLIDLNDPDNQEFSDLIDKYKMKLNNPADFTKRLGIFRKAKEALKGFQAKQKNAQFALNKFSLMSEDEQKQFFGIMPSNLTTLPRQKRNALNNIIESVAPSSFDYRTYGKVTSIKDQGGCGSCWAFTTAAAIESQYLLRHNQSLDLSEQNLVSCNTGAYGCGGGDVVNTINYVAANGITTESCMPYTATNGVCTTTCNNQKYSIGGYRYFGTDESTYALQMYNYGPPTMIFYVPPAFLSYKSGVLDMPYAQCVQNYVGMHGMIIVGYTADYWILKNSWGTNWGEQGYVRVKRGQNFCGITSQVVAPYLNTPAPTPVPTPPPTPPPTSAPSPFAGCPNGDGITSMTNTWREYILQRFNAKRSELARGVLQTIDRPSQIAPSAKNMKKFVYNCTLEALALQAMTTCGGLNSPNAVFKQYSSQAPHINGTLDLFLNRYWFQISNPQVWNNGRIIADGEVSYFYDNTDQFACAFRNISETCSAGQAYMKGLLVCAMNTPSYNGLYYPGSACTSNAACTTPGYNKCDTSLGLCYA